MKSSEMDKKKSERENDLAKELFSVKENKYAGDYGGHYLEIYKLYVEMADRISSRRQTTNSFFLTVNTAIVALMSYMEYGSIGGINDCCWIIGVAGMALCYLWFRIVKSYKGLNTGKFEVIHEIERKLPIAPYDAEWKALGEGKDPKKYLPFTIVEMIVPWVFFALHLAVMLSLFPWAAMFSMVS